LKSRTSNFLSFGDKNDPITEISLFGVDAHTDSKLHIQLHVIHAGWLSQFPLAAVPSSIISLAPEQKCAKGSGR